MSPKSAVSLMIVIYGSSLEIVAETSRAIVCPVFSNSRFRFTVSPYSGKSSSIT